MTTKKTPILSTVLLALLSLALLGIFVLLLWRGPWWFDGAHLRTKDLEPADGVVITGFRTVLVAVGVAVTAAVGLVYTHRSHRTALELLEHTRTKDREQADLTREGQITDRYVEAIKLLAASGPDGLTERLGGIYALERIMNDSAKDHPTVVQVLASFVRQHVSIPDRWEARDPEGVLPDVTDDVQAAVTALGRRPPREEKDPINLNYTSLRACDLSNGRFERALFQRVDFTAASLMGADLRRADLAGAKLAHAYFMDTDLRGARLVGYEDAEVRVTELMWTIVDMSTKMPEGLATDPAVQRMMHPSGASEEG
ncbi:pentapeptide repeat-containing protein [Streptomyces sp. SID8374]|uniref:pentapeptide repeat-containing protein n=1 Tax=Streptomyces sp. SID8374 TaxID=2690354 RepID=UPI0013711ECE|nr:pentapeptide repeat-containing protein [Streptomyces sp. SID8374]MYX18389.1 pentapeptide repeat-containing protein [Streptomyces sp. SID8374]MYX18467.1 pentapeptide repeat-containing protein [Streptomyces sp. SID8374]